MNRRTFLAVAGACAAGIATRTAAAPEQGFTLVLGGGGCRAHGHVGVIRVLERSGLRPSLIVGTSAGSLVGALYAAGLSADQLERQGHNLAADSLRDWRFPGLGLFGGDAIRRFVVARVGPVSIESLPTRFVAVATDLKSGELRAFDRGDLAQAVQASSSVPGLIEPVRIGGRLYVDGSLVSPVPVGVARRYAANPVVAVDVSFPPEEAELDGAYDALYQAFSILTRRLALEERAKADVLIAPRIPVHNDMKPATLKALVDSGERAAADALPRLQALLGSAKVK